MPIWIYLYRDGSLLHLIKLLLKITSSLSFVSGWNLQKWKRNCSVVADYNDDDGGEGEGDDDNNDYYYYCCYHDKRKLAMMVVMKLEISLKHILLRLRWCVHKHKRLVLIGEGIKWLLVVWCCFSERGTKWNDEDFRLFHQRRATYTELFRRKSKQHKFFISSTTLPTLNCPGWLFILV